MTYCSITFCNCSLFGFDFFFLRFASTDTQVSLRLRNPGFDQYGGCILWFVVTRFLVCTKEQVLNESDPRSDVHYLGSSENKA